MPIDWVPQPLYGQNRSVPASSSIIMPLIQPPDSAIQDANVVETQDDTLFVERIIGTVYHFLPQVSVSFLRWGWRILPLSPDESTGGMDQPWTVMSMFDEDHANIRWWDERVFYEVLPIELDSPEMNAFAHYKWAHVDIHPRQVVGRNNRLWPCIVFANHSADPITVNSRLRTLVKYT